MARELPRGPIEIPKASREFLKRKYARESLDGKSCCDCPGCGSCEGFVVGCKCDEDMSAIRKAQGRE